MIKHLVKIIWNQRRRNGWIAAEILLVFVVLWYIIDSLMAVGKVFFAPMGWDIDHVYWISMGVEEVDRNEMDSTYRYITSGRSMLTAIDRIKTCPGVEAVGAGLMSMPHTGENRYMHVAVNDSINVEYVKLLEVTPGFLEVFNFRPMEGEKKDWEEMLNGRQVVLSAGLFREFQEKGGKRDEGISFWGDRRSIGGVTADFRADRFTKSCSWLFMPLTDEEIAEDDTDFHVKIAIRVNPSADHDFPEFFVKQMEKQLSIDRLYLLDVIPYSDLRYSMEWRKIRVAEPDRRDGILAVQYILGDHRHVLVPHGTTERGDGVADRFGFHPFQLKGDHDCRGGIIVDIDRYPGLIDLF